MADAYEYEKPYNLTGQYQETLAPSDLGELCSTNTSGIANVRKTYQDNGGWSAQVFYKDVNGKTKGKKFYFSTYGEDRAVILATEYVTQMKKLITEERTRLEQLKESMYGVC